MAVVEFHPSAAADWFFRASAGIPLMTLAHHADTTGHPHDVRWMRDATFANQQCWLDRLSTGLPDPRQDPASHPVIATRLETIGPFSLARTGRSGVIMVTGEVSDTPTTSGTLDAALATALTWLRTRGSGELLVWAREPMPALDIALLTRGAHDGFVPHWMWRSLTRPIPTFVPPAHVEIRLAIPTDREAILANPAIPYLDHGQLTTMLALGQRTDPPICAVIARENGFLRKPKVVGFGAINVATMTGNEPPRTAALFNLGVDPAVRGRGIGTALTLAAMQAAQEAGALGIGLNATPDGERVYRKLGFRTTGHGQTWSMSSARLRHQPDDAAIAFAEALAYGETDDLDPTLAETLLMPNGESPVVFAARFVKPGMSPRAITWLLEHGATPDVIALWDAGLRDEAIGLMIDPHFRDRRAGRRATTPLHEAIEADDRELVRALLAAGANRAIRDAQYHGTADDWARALDRREIQTILADPDS